MKYNTGVPRRRFSSRKRKGALSVDGYRLLRFEQFEPRTLLAPLVPGITVTGTITLDSYSGIPVRNAEVKVTSFCCGRWFWGQRYRGDRLNFRTAWSLACRVG
jgi:hypothetical protein